MRRLAILCPGQGAQNADMFELACQDADTREQFEQWELPQYLGMPLAQILASRDLIFRNRYAQVLLVAAAMAAWSSVQKFLPAPALVMGYSIGELSAYAIAGSLTADDALSLAVTRAQLMDDACSLTPAQGMASVIGLMRETLAVVLQRHGLYIAIAVGESSFIVGGLAADIAAAVPDIASLGGEVSAIPVEIASHTPLMHAATAGFQRALEAGAFKAPHVAVMSGISAEPILRQDTARTHLSRQLTETIRWSDCMDACVEQGVSVALELGPGAALSRMLQKRHPGIICRSLQDFRSLAGLQDWVDRYCR
ncbi:MAG: acyltransferase domain-containing protein [Pseudomonadota bacterium]